VQDALVTEPGEVLDEQGHRRLLVRSHDIDRGQAQVAEQHHGGRSRGQCGDLLGGQLWADEDDALAALGKDRPGRLGLTAAGGHGAEHDLVAVLVGGGVDAVDDLGMEVAAEAEHHSDHPGA
jgi:hypothetical protein